MIDWKTQFELLEEQIEHMLVMVARRFEENEQKLVNLSENAEVRILEFEIGQLDKATRTRTVVCVANGPDLEYAMVNKNESFESTLFHRSNTFVVSELDILAGVLTAVIRSRSNPQSSDSKTLEKDQ